LTTNQRVAGSTPAGCAISFGFPMNIYEQRFKGISDLIGGDSLEKLKHAHFLVAGLGGVGSWTVEALARTGVGKLTLVDLDDICTSNTNRQLHALDGNYGQMKAEVLAKRIKKINPEIEVTCILSFLTEKNIEEIITSDIDFVVDAIDSVKDKCTMIRHCYKMKIGIVSAGGSAGQHDPFKITHGELSKTKYDYLLKGVRKKLKKEYNYPLGRSGARVQCVYSTEHPAKPSVCGTSSANACDGGLGTTTYMTGIYGFLLSHLSIKEFLLKIPK
jgi:tRNA A37 threonylcarbamoyladenosine dehydratase